ncbi:MAG: GNAT family N-acetyltransferase [Enterococcus lacertideformus]|uniref:GNAT family N-acetyltransferase n=1 Tax=Enterococcus lacertideformus TaxID=2771493 RepID=A0A931AU07_9ENTE|nr:GNAT family N-acetyltransferase [Enterococcus lacertideformus]
MSKLKKITDGERAKQYICQFEQYLTPTLTEKNIDLSKYTKKLLNYGKIIAYQEKGIISYYLNEKERKCFISILSVSPEHQSQGIGGSLMKQAESDAKNHQLTCIELAVEKENFGGIRFYKRHGFVYSSETSSQYLYKKIFDGI